LPISSQKNYRNDFCIVVLQEEFMQAEIVPAAQKELASA
jgi:hypothetical protein